MLLPIALFPLAGLMPLTRTTAGYGADVTFPFLGGFVLATAICRWDLGPSRCVRDVAARGTTSEDDRRRDHGRDRVHQHVRIAHRAFACILTILVFTYTVFIRALAALR